MEEDLYRKGIAAAEAGDLQKAHQFFAEVLKRTPKSEKAWLALGRYVADSEKKEFCFEKVLSINPDNQTAQDLLKALHEPVESQRPFFTEEELSVAWEEDEEKDLDEKWGSEDAVPDEWKSEEPTLRESIGEEELAGDWDEEEALGDTWGSEDAVPDEWKSEESFLREDDQEDPLAGGWEDEGGLDDGWGSEESLPEEKREELFLTEDKGEELPDDWGEEEESIDWGDQSPWSKKESSNKGSLQSRLEKVRSEEGFRDERSPKDGKLSDVWSPEESSFEESTRDKKKKKGSCFGKILSVFFSLILIVLLAVVALLALIDPENPPEIIEPYFRMVIPAPTATIEVPTATEGVEATPPPAKLPPTWTLSPSPIPSQTPRPTPTPTFTVTPTPTQDVGALDITTDETGWTRYTFPQQEWGISAPPDWVYFDLYADDYDQMLSEIATTNPSLAERYTPTMLEEIVASGVRFLVADGETAESDVVTNLNIVISDLAVELDFDAYVEESIQQLQETFSEETQITQTRSLVGGTEAAELIYEAAVTNADGAPLEIVYTQYLLLHEDTEYVLTFTTPKDLFEEKYPLFSESAQSFAIKETP
ncbi:MAG: hypothetical protein MAG431_00510 [Chloroflexi bacterium]|nr:hypothetical protein [Chloroflexota bacterium]